MTNSSFDKFAEDYDLMNGDIGDYTHQNMIDPALFEAMASFEDMVIYDVGCGNGYLSRRLAREGAKEVWASDLSSKLIQIAQTKYKNPEEKVKYFTCEASDFTQIPSDYFNIVFANMAVRYFSDFHLFAQGVSKILKTGGKFVFTADHPLRNLAMTVIRPKDYSLENVVKSGTNYLGEYEGESYNPWTGEQKGIRYWHRPISYYVNELSNQGLHTEFMIEPVTKTLRVHKDDNSAIATPIPTRYAIRCVKRQ